MIENGLVIAVVSGAVVLVGAVNVCYQIYKMTEIDARARGLKHPRFWAFIAMNGNNSSGLLLYLLGRRKFPVISMPETDQKEIDARKKRAGAGLIFIVLGGIGLILYISLMK